MAFPPGRHRAVGCFHALLSVLQQALCTFIQELSDFAKTEGASALEKLSWRSATGPVKTQYEFICDHWASHFAALLDPEVKNDLKLVLKVQGQGFYSARASEAVFVRGMEAIERVLKEIEANDEVLELVDALKRMLGMCDERESESESESASESEADSEHSEETEAESSEKGTIVLDAAAAIAVSASCLPLETLLKNRISSPEVFLHNAHSKSEALRATQVTINQLVEAGDAFLLWRDCRRAELCYSLAIGRLQAMERQAYATAARGIGVLSVGEREQLGLKCHIQRAQCRLRLHKFSLVLFDAESVINRDDEHLDAHRLRCNAYIGLCDRDNAIEACQQLLALAPTDAAYQSKLEYLEQCEELTHDVAFVLAVPPDLRKSSNTRVDRATKELRLLSVLGDGLLHVKLAEADELPDTTSDMIIAYEDVLTRSIQLVEDMSSSSEESTETEDTTATYACRAICRFAQDNHDEAVEDARVVLSLVPSWMTGWRLLCVAAMARKDWQVADQACKRVVEDSQPSTLGEFWSRCFWTIAERIKESEASIVDPDSDESDDKSDNSSESEAQDDEERGYQDQADHRDVQLRDGVNGVDAPAAIVSSSDSLLCTSDQHSMDELVVPAVASRPTAVSETPGEDRTILNDEITACIRAGVSAFTAKRYPVAEAKFSEALSLLVNEISYDDRKIKAYGHRTRCRLAMGRFASALDDADAGLLLDPRWLDGHRLKCKALMGLERWAEAEVECDAVIAVAPQDTVFASYKSNLATKTDSRRATSGSAPRVVAAPTRGLSSPDSTSDSFPIRTAKAMIAAGNVSSGAIPYISQFLDSIPSDGLVATPSDRAELCALRAQCYFELDDPTTASSDATKSAVADYDCVEAYRWIAASHIKLERYDTAVNACGTGLSLNPRHQELRAIRDQLQAQDHLLPLAKVMISMASRLAKVNRLYAARKYNSALLSVSSSLTALFTVDLREEEEPGIVAKKVSFYGQGARCHLELKQFDKAIRDASNGVTVQPSWVEGHRLLCRAWMGLQRWDEAMKECAIVLSHVPHDTSFKRLRYKIQEQSSRPPPTAASNRWVRQRSKRREQPQPEPVPDQSVATALTAQISSFFADESTCIEESRQEEADIPSTQVRLTQREFLLALSDARVAQAANPTWHTPHILACLALMGLERWDEALTACDQVLQLLPGEQEFIAYRLAIVAKLEEKRVREEELAILMDKRRQYTELGVSVMLNGNWGGAEHLFRNAVATYEDGDESEELCTLLTYRCRCRYWLGWHALALEDARSVLRLKPASPETQCIECEALMALLRWREAMTACAKAQELLPIDLSVNKNRIEILKQLSKPSTPSLSTIEEIQAVIRQGVQELQGERYSQAETWFTKVLDATKPSTQPSLEMMMLSFRARCRLATGQYEAAESDATSALAINPTWTEGYRIQCKAMTAMEKWEMAMKACDHVLRVVPGDEEFKNRKQELQERCSSTIAGHLKQRGGSTGDPDSNEGEPDHEMSDNSSESEAQDDEDRDYQGQADHRDAQSNESPLYPVVVSDPRIMNELVDPALARRSTPTTINETPGEDRTILNDEITPCIHAGLAAFTAKTYPVAEAKFSQALLLLANEISSDDRRLKVYGHRTRCRLAMGRFAPALDDADAGLALDPRWLDGHRLKCKALMGLECWAEAEAECDLVIGGAPQDTVFAQHKSMLATKTDRRSTTTNSAPRVIAAPTRGLSSVGSPTDSLPIQSAKAAIACKNLSGVAIPYISHVLNSIVLDGQIVSRSDRAELFALRAQCYFQLDDPTTASADAAKSAVVDADCVEAYRWIAASHIKLERYDTAVNACATGLSLNPQHQELRAIRDQLHALSHLRSSATVLQSMAARSAMAHRLYVARDYELALQCVSSSLTRLFTVDPREEKLSSIIAKKVSFYGHGARCHLELRQFKKAIRDATNGLTVQPSWVDGHRLLCRAWMGLEQWDEAQKQCAIVLTHVPHDTSFKQLQYKLQEPSRRPASRLQSWRRERPQAEPVPNQSLAAALTAQISSFANDGFRRVEESQYEEAEILYTQAIYIYEQCKAAVPSIVPAPMYVQRSRGRVMEGKFALALSDALVARAADPTWYKPYTLGCLALMGLERWDEALIACDQALELLPPGEETFTAHRITIVAKLEEQRVREEEHRILMDKRRQYTERGICLMQDGDWEEAESLLRKAVAMYEEGDESEELCAVLTYRCRCRYWLGWHALALEDARSVLRLKPASPEIQCIECVALMALLRWREALVACDKAQELRVSMEDDRVEILKQLAKPEIVSLTTKEETQAVIRQGVEELQQDRYSQAEAWFTIVLDAVAPFTQPKLELLALGFRARCRLATGQYEDAVSDAAAALTLNPAWTEGDRIQCRAMMAMEKWELAMKACYHVLWAAPGDEEFTKLKQELLARLG